jgi:hypothetical protein
MFAILIQDITTTTSLSPSDGTVLQQITTQLVFKLYRVHPTDERRSYYNTHAFAAVCSDVK